MNSQSFMKLICVPFQDTLKNDPYIYQYVFDPRPHYIFFPLCKVSVGKCRDVI